MENKNQNGRYRVVITDTKTEKVIMDEYHNVIIAGFNNGKESSTALSLTAANGPDIALGIGEAKDAIEQTKASLLSQGVSPKVLEVAIKAAEFFIASNRGAKDKNDDAKTEQEAEEVTYVGGDDE